MTAPSMPPVVAPDADPQTIGSRLARRDNALNFVRLVLASLVIVSHMWPIGGYPGADTAWQTGDIGLGGAAVAGFFAASGYLIAGSRDRLPFIPFLWRRLLRIYPAFWVSLVVVAFVFAPLSTLWQGAWTPGEGARHVVANATLWISDFNVGGTIPDVPFRAWNGSLWTLFYEMAAYICLGLLFIVPLARRPLVLGALFVAAVASQPLMHMLGVTTTIYLQASWLGTFFLAGALLWSLREHLEARWWMVGLAGLVVAAAVHFGCFKTLGALPFAYVVLALGALLPTRIGAKNDVSYGVYIYAFPIQQMLVVVGLTSLVGPWAASAVTWVLTLILAWGSWRLVEKPLLRFKTLVPAR